MDHDEAGPTRPDPLAEVELSPENAAAVERIMAEAAKVCEGRREKGRTREDLAAEFGEVLGVPADPEDRDWPVEIIREHYMDGRE